jgi:hypothetical protein
MTEAISLESRSIGVTMEVGEGVFERVDGICENEEGD